MTLHELDTYFRTFLKIEDYPADPSQNGIQIENGEADTKQIETLAFAVDACEATAVLASRAGADMLFVHHGLFWRDCEKLTGHHYKRVAAFVKNGIALYACHLPLDACNPYGNNYGLAARLELSDTEPFGEWRGRKIGVKGRLPAPLSIRALSAKALKPGEKPLRILPFGKASIETVGIISGGAGEEAVQAAQEGLDAYITGEIAHEQFHVIKECGINVIAGGHYQTECVGVQLVMEKLSAETGIRTMFIDFPTGL